ncbi:hypothetical protein EKO27_g5477 [Xylaria grammica]|uniref:Uncharacterized protein n=1 Tax=Xylaria grammica TaxID=363999 RepID=A0A439D5E0_9PEZI|nr:hypothetical protein EKO27_g5477 [Xylaria grammica]
MVSITPSTALRPFRKGDQFDLPVPGIQYYPEHPLIKQLNEACTHEELGNIQALVARWQQGRPASPPRGPPHYPMGTLEPTLFHAIRSDRADVVNYLLDEGVKFSGLSLAEAVTSQASPAMWQVFLDHGLDINAPLEDAGTSPLGYILLREDLIRWFLERGADPNAESSFGLTPFLRAVGHAPLSTVALLHAAGGSVAIAVPFVCSPWPPNLTVSDPSQSELNSDERLAVLRYLLDAGANPDAPKWAHNSRGYGSDFDWGSALNTALTNGSHRLAEELLRHGARTDVPTMNIASRGETALEIAQKYAPNMVPFIMECGMARVVGEVYP